MTTATSTSRLRGILSLDPVAFQEIADNPGALRGAVLVVIGATLLAGLGGLLWTQWGGAPPSNATYELDVRRFIARSVIIGGVAQVAMWFAWVGVTYAYLRSFGEALEYWRLARVMGYAFAPVTLELFIMAPGIEFAAAAVAFGYTIAATVTAVESAVPAPRGRIVLSVLVGFALFAIVLALLGDGSNDLAPGVFALDPLPTSIGFLPLRQ